MLYPSLNDFSYFSLTIIASYFKNRITGDIFTGKSNFIFYKHF